MNPLLLQILATRANGNPALAELLARVQTSSGTDSSVDIRELLLKQTEGNPLLALFSKRCAEPPVSLSSAPTVIDVEPTPQKQRAGQMAGDAAAASAGDVGEAAESLTLALNVLQQRNDLLAAALGACCSCWGQDPQCRLCRGRGRPGFAIPDEQLFREFVLPSIQMLRAQKAASSVSSPPTNPKTAESNA
jgi:hypothetical protein